MQIAIVADIHANAVALNGLGDMLESAGHVGCLGDLLGYYRGVSQATEEVAG